MSSIEKFCEVHPERAAVEHCEICGKALCGYCLYYTEDGQRLCERHAEHARHNGVNVIPPAVYAEGIISSQASAAEASSPGESSPKGAVEKKNVFYQGNNNDLNSFIAMIVGVVMAGMCCGASYCLPFVAVMLGIVGLINAKNAIDPGRARLHAIIGIVTGGIWVLVIVACIALYSMGFAAVLTSSNFNTSPVFRPSPTFTAPPTALEPRQRTATARARPPTPTRSSPTPSHTPTPTSDGP